MNWYSLLKMANFEPPPRMVAQLVRIVSEQWMAENIATLAAECHKRYGEDYLHKVPEATYDKLIKADELPTPIQGAYKAVRIAVDLKGWKYADLAKNMPRDPQKLDEEGGVKEELRGRHEYAKQLEADPNATPPNADQARQQMKNSVIAIITKSRPSNVPVSGAAFGPSSMVVMFYLDQYSSPKDPKIRASVRHELSHFAQHYSSWALTGRSPQKGVAPMVGMPPKAIRTPQFSGYGTRNVPEQMKQKGMTSLHALPDIEFHPDMADSKFRLQQALKKSRPENRMNVFQNHLTNDDFLKNLRTVPAARGKWQRAVSEMKKHFDQLQGAARPK